METTVNVTTATLHVELDGTNENPVLLLWPPGGSTVRVWDHLVPKLLDEFFVIRADIRGYGKSIPHTDAESQYTFEQYAKDASDVLDNLQIKNATFGRSCGVLVPQWCSPLRTRNE